MKRNNKISDVKIWRIIICIGLVISFISMVSPLSVSHAQRLVKPEWVMPKHYPNGFNGMGHIYNISINEGEVVIDDKTIKLSPYAEYHTPTQKNASSGIFVPGKLVGYIIDSEDTIVSMLLITNE